MRCNLLPPVGAFGSGPHGRGRCCRRGLTASRSSPQRAARSAPRFCASRRPRHHKSSTKRGGSGTFSPSRWAEPEDCCLPVHHVQARHGRRSTSCLALGIGSLVSGSLERRRCRGYLGLSWWLENISRVSKPCAPKLPFDQNYSPRPGVLLREETISAALQGPSGRR